MVILCLKESAIGILALALQYIGAFQRGFALVCFEIVSDFLQFQVVELAVKRGKSLLL